MTLTTDKKNIPVIGVDCYNQTLTGGVSKTLNSKATDSDHIPVVIVGGCYTIDEKMANTYIHEDMANTLAARDYKQPQTVVIYEDIHKEQKRTEL